MLVPHPENPNQRIEVGHVEREAIEVCPYRETAWHKDKMCKSCLAISKKIHSIRINDAESVVAIVNSTPATEKRLGFLEAIIKGSGTFADEVAESTKQKILLRLNEEFKS